jgi:hypothetical protein
MGSGVEIPSLWGRSLRFVVVNELMRAGGPVTVAELVEVVAEAGFTLRGRASKVISDGLRWEVRRGRVARLARGVYRYRRAPRSTARRIRAFGQFALRWIDAVSTGRQPPPTPRDPRSPPWCPYHDPTIAPWWQMGWIWVL